MFSWLTVVNPFFNPLTMISSPLLYLFFHFRSGALTVINIVCPNSVYLCSFHINLIEIDCLLSAGEIGAVVKVIDFYFCKWSSISGKSSSFLSLLKQGLSLHFMYLITAIPILFSCFECFSDSFMLNWLGTRYRYGLCGLIGVCRKLITGEKVQ